MGTNLKELIDRKQIELEDLKNKVIIIDSYNQLYQYLTTIRGRDGSLLMDSKGNVTSHLAGLFTRTANLLQQGIKPVFVFDGTPPKLKHEERERRKQLKIEAEKKYQEAVKREDEEDMKKYAARTTRLTEDMINDAKELIRALGLPVIEAPSEGEAQAAHMVKNKDGFASVSQDFDSLLFGAPRLVRNLSISGKKKKVGQLNYEIIKPEMIELEKCLHKLGINQDQLIVVGILTGTDYNPGGIKGIGPKNALKLVREHKNNFDHLFKEAKWDDNFDFAWQEIFELFNKIPVTDSYKIEWHTPEEKKILKFLVDEHDFSIERVKSTLEKLNFSKETKKQASLGKWF